MTKKSAASSAKSKTREAITPAKTVVKPVPTVWQLTRQSLAVLWQRRGLFGGIMIVYGLLLLVLVQGIVGTAAKRSAESDGIEGTITNFFKLASNTGSSANAGQNAYQFFVVVIVSLAVIWALRHVLADPKVKVRIRDAFYKGMYPLVPFILVLLVISLQLIPLGIGATLYGWVVNTGIAVNPIEHILWGGLSLAIASLSFYFLTSSIFGLYIATLPDMTPLKALKAARKLVAGRRWLSLRKLLFLPLLLLVAGAVIMVPIIIVVPPISAWVFFVLSLLALLLVHSYLYNVYRGFIGE